ncbi:MAG: hypothetical protein JNK90_13905 [Planctomycetaceae bacterium]|nr:hypothetical protein [Planctomycetaceae bacterium]
MRTALFWIFAIFASVTVSTPAFAFQEQVLDRRVIEVLDAWKEHQVFFEGVKRVKYRISYSLDLEMLVDYARKSDEHCVEFSTKSQKSNRGTAIGCNRQYAFKLSQGKPASSWEIDVLRVGHSGSSFILNKYKDIYRSGLIVLPDNIPFGNIPLATSNCPITDVRDLEDGKRRLAFTCSIPSQNEVDVYGDGYRYNYAILKKGEIVFDASRRWLPIKGRFDLESVTGEERPLTWEEEVTWDYIAVESDRWYLSSCRMERKNGNHSDYSKGDDRNVFWSVMNEITRQDELSINDLRLARFGLPEPNVGGWGNLNLWVWIPLAILVFYFAIKRFRQWRAA